MAIVHGYATLSDLKARLDLTSAADDAILEQVIEAASREIDGMAARTFYAETATRVLSAAYPDVLYLDRDLISITSIATDDARDRSYATTWSAADYETDGNAPYQAVYLAPGGSRHFPVGRRTVQIVGSWGYGAVAPPPIREACLLIAARLYKRKDAPFGVAGSAEHGQIQTLSSQDPDAKKLIEPYRRFGMVGV